MRAHPVRSACERWGPTGRRRRGRAAARRTAAPRTGSRSQPIICGGRRKRVTPSSALNVVYGTPSCFGYALPWSCGCRVRLRTQQSGTRRKRSAWNYTVFRFAICKRGVAVTFSRSHVSPCSSRDKTRLHLMMAVRAKFQSVRYSDPARCLWSVWRQHRGVSTNSHGKLNALPISARSPLSSRFLDSSLYAMLGISPVR